MISGYSHAASMQNSTPLSEEDKLNERKRDILVLVMRFLYDYGYLNTYHSLCNESSISLGQVDVADNVDLWTIVQEYVDYYNTRFGRYPKLVRQPYSNVNDYQMATAVSPLPQFSPSPVQTAVTVPAAQAAPVARNPAPRAQPVKPEPKRAPQPTGPSIYVTPGPASQSHAIGTSSQGSVDNIGFNAFTTKLGGNDQLTQEEFVHVLASNPTSTVMDLFSFNRPKRTNSKRRSAHLNLTDDMEDALYAVIGCANVGWAIKSINPSTREYLNRRFQIDKDVLQLFFKNRAQKPKRMRTMGDGEDVSGVEFEEQ